MSTAGVDEKRSSVRIPHLLLYMGAICVDQFVEKGDLKRSCRLQQVSETRHKQHGIHRELSLFTARRHARRAGAARTSASERGRSVHRVMDGRSGSKCGSEEKMKSGGVAPSYPAKKTSHFARTPSITSVRVKRSW